MCDRCRNKLSGEVCVHVARVMLIGGLGVCRDVTRAIAAAYCGEMAGEIDAETRIWTGASP
jgi:hypothetical protein